MYKHYFMIGIEIMGAVIMLLLILNIHRTKQIEELIIKNHNTVMTTLADFQTVASEINTATQNISAYVQGSGMSAADQATALSTVQSALAGLTAAIPAAPAETQPAQ